jgi:hypothetical protein
MPAALLCAHFTDKELALREQARGHCCIRGDCVLAARLLV